MFKKVDLFSKHKDLCEKFSNLLGEDYASCKDYKQIIFNSNPISQNNENVENKFVDLVDKTVKYGVIFGKSAVNKLPNCIDSLLRKENVGTNINSGPITLEQNGIKHLTNLFIEAPEINSQIQNIFRNFSEIPLKNKLDVSSQFVSYLMQSYFKNFGKELNVNENFKTNLVEELDRAKKRLDSAS